MKKNIYIKILKSLVALTCSALLIVGISINSFASDEQIYTPNTALCGEYTENIDFPEGLSGENDAFILSESNAENTSPDSEADEENIFEEIYLALESNADKIFSILAFVGTLIVGIGYKSGLLPLLGDALSKLKAAVDGLNENGERLNADTKERLLEMENSIQNMERELGKISSNMKHCDELINQRKSLGTLIEGQIDMLYAIFMSSSLPQYQKEEIGTRIQSMREELASYEKTTE